MASTFLPASLVPGTLLPASTTVVYTAPILTTVKISQLTITNTDTLVHKVLVYLASNSTVAGAKDLIASVTLSVGQSYSVYQAIDQVLAPGATIQAQCDLDS